MNGVFVKSKVAALLQENQTLSATIFAWFDCQTTDHEGKDIRNPNYQQMYALLSTRYLHEHFAGIPTVEAYEANMKQNGVLTYLRYISIEELTMVNAQTADMRCILMSATNERNSIGQYEETIHFVMENGEWKSDGFLSASIH